MILSYLTGFHQKTFRERQDIIKALYPDLNGSLTSGGLDLTTADLMIENCIGMVSLPVGLGLYFVINEREYKVPMCVEEPSCVAAACNAAKIVAGAGGFRATSTDPVMIGQLQILGVDLQTVEPLLNAAKQRLLAHINTTYCANMYARGGGVQDITVKQAHDQFCIVEFHINVQEAMGGNHVSTICEKATKDVIAVTGGTPGIRILSNFCTERVTRVSASVPVAAIGEEVAQRMVMANEFAKSDIYCATTHNKGIMNGIDAAALAAGQDFRAIEAAAHAWASRSGTYQPLTDYWIDAGHLHFTMSLPISVGTKGGVLQSNQLYQSTHYILGYPASQELAQVLLAVGLAVNFSTLRALVSTGLQKGHMQLHARNIAISAGVPNDYVNEVAEYMKKQDEFSERCAQEYLTVHHLHSRDVYHPSKTGSFSTFLVDLSDLPIPIRLNISFISTPLLHIGLTKSSQSFSGVQLEIQQKLLGEQKGYSWMTSFFLLLDQVKFTEPGDRENQEIRNKLKLLAVLINIISHNLLAQDFDYAQEALRCILASNDNEFFDLYQQSQRPEFLTYGVCLIRECYKVFLYYLESQTSKEISNSTALADEIVQEVQTVVRANIASREKSGVVDFDEFLDVRKKQMSAKLMYLCDYLGSDNILLTHIKDLKGVGDVFEIKFTALRDLAACLKNPELAEPNLYKTWLRTKQLSTDKSYPDMFITDIRALTEQKLRKYPTFQEKVNLVLDKMYQYYAQTKGVDFKL